MVLKNKEEDIPNNFGTNTEEFKHYVGRYPKSWDEFNDWVHYMKKGMDAQLDWDMICRCAAENIR